MSSDFSRPPKNFSLAHNGQIKSPRLMRRRDLTLGLGAGALLLGPVTSLIRPRRARAATPLNQRRFLMFYTPNGHAPSGFETTGNGSGFQLGSSLQPARDVQAYMSSVLNLSVKNRNNNQGRDFHGFLPKLTTGIEGTSPETGFGPSIDQVIADLTESEPLGLRVYDRLFAANMGNTDKISWKRSAIPNRLQNDAVKVYEDVFGSFMPDKGAPGEGTALLEQKKSVLDFVVDDLKVFRQRVEDSEQRDRLDLHLESIETLEKDLASALDGNGGASCDLGDLEATSATDINFPQGNVWNAAEFAKHGTIMRRLMTTALACGLRTSGTLFWQREGGGLNPDLLGGRLDHHHWMSHGEGNQAQWRRTDEHYAGLWGETLMDLKDAGILDDTLVVWSSLLRNERAADHSHNDLKFVIGGGKNLGFKYQVSAKLQSAGSPDVAASRSDRITGVNDLWTTVQRAFGKEGDFGERVVGPIEEIWDPVT